MANNIPFQAMGKSVCIQASTANTQSNVFTITADSPCQQYYLTNHDVTYSVNVLITTDSSANISLPSANGAYGICLPPFGYRTITGPQVKSSSNVYARIISDGTNVKVTVCPGEGL
jgi:hypothetical protein